MIRFKNINYQDSVIQFKLDNEFIYGKEELTQNTKSFYTKLAKFYNVKGISQLNKDNLIQFLVDKFGYEYKTNNYCNELCNELCKLETNFNKLEIGNTVELAQLIGNLSINTNGFTAATKLTNPFDEMNYKIAELKKLNTNCIKNEEDGIRNCYAYRCWLWKTHKLTYTEEMERVDKYLKERK